ncbi:hypothetical protein AB205_0094660 [Aquarana catesbeiana]|uniref:Uncharacterized protein n=1 Tax=Aquarana catesbeiana TaxID=8400 RepID=A0A2G9SDC0_AQUCT|nr:hypothetical protein AB205_0094660 [Aquarana catesbeiana]
MTSGHTRLLKGLTDRKWQLLWKRFQYFRGVAPLFLCAQQLANPQLGWGVLHMSYMSLWIARYIHLS